MKLRSLSMRLFRQHVDGTISFPDGLVGIIGSNGSGKTTILEAVGFALFGSRALRGRAEDARTRSAPSKSGRGKRDQETRVVLSLEHDGLVYRIDRSLSDAALYVGGEAVAVAVGNREVSARVSAIVGMSYEEFVATYCTEQKGLEFLSGKKGATEREKFIIRMMGYDRLEQAQDLIRVDRRDKRASLQGFEASLGTREELEDRLRVERESHERAREKYEESARTLMKVESEFKVAHEKLRRLEDVRGRFLKERDVVQALEVRVEERSKRRRSLVDSIAIAEEDLARSLKPLIGGRVLEDVISELKREIMIHRAEVERVVDEAQRAEVSWQGELAALRAEKLALRGQLDQVLGRVRRIGSLESEGECPTCGQSLGETFENVSAHLNAEKVRLEERIRALGVAEEERGNPPELIQSLRAKRVESSGVVERLQAKLQELQNCDSSKEKISALCVETAAIDSDIQGAMESLERARARLIDCKFSEDEYLREKGAHDAAQRLLEVARLQRVRLEGEMGMHAAMVARSTEDLAKFDERRLELEKARRDVRILDECDRIVTDFRKFVNTSIRPRMAELASEYLADLTDGRYSAVELEEDFTPTVVEDGEPKRVISGGEEDILNLCMRISLSHMLAERAGQNFSLLMLDEVFGSLDEGRRSNVLALLEKLRRRFEQIIIITHLDDIKDGVQHLIQVEYDEGAGVARVLDSWDEVFDGPEVANL